MDNYSLWQCTSFFHAAFALLELNPRNRDHDITKQKSIAINNSNEPVTMKIYALSGLSRELISIFE
jgi:hypothetical protein